MDSSAESELHELIICKEGGRGRYGGAYGYLIRNLGTALMAFRTPSMGIRCIDVNIVSHKYLFPKNIVQILKKYDSGEKLVNS